MSSKEVDAFRGALEAQGIVLEFGQRVHEPDSEQLAVALTDRLVLTPETAKRLAIALDAALQVQHKSTTEKLPVPVKSAAASEAVAPSLGVEISTSSGVRSEQRATLRGSSPVNAPADLAGEKAGLLLRLVAELGAPFQQERSFRIAKETMQANRYLLTLDKSDIPGDALKRVLDIAEQVNMPGSLREIVSAGFDAARCIHFGFEGSAEGIICKLYLERAITEQEKSAAIAGGEPVSMFLAYKWEIASGKHVTTKYLWYPNASGELISSRLAQVYAAMHDRTSAAIALSALQLALGKVSAERLQFLEVLEEENQRRSFDLNVYEAGLQVKDIQPLLSQMRDHFEIRPGHYQALYDQIKNRPLGHLAGGVHRNDLDFFNIYYGVEGYPLFSENSREV
jgi:hypothetical protein